MKLSKGRKFSVQVITSATAADEPVASDDVTGSGMKLKNGAHRVASLKKRVHIR